jgi:hypothetical protein
LTEGAHRRVVGRFASWHVQRRLRGFADQGLVTSRQTQQARGEICQAIAFLAWLDGRQRALAACRQTDVDAWYAGGYAARKLTHAFLCWAMADKLLPPAGRPPPGHRQPGPDQPEGAPGPALAASHQRGTRVAHPRRGHRDAALRQPLTRVLSLTLDDVIQGDGQVAIRLGAPPAPVPEPFAALLLRHMGQRLILTTATNADARWLFPGRRGGQPMTPDTVERRLKLAGIPARRGRSAALRQLVLQAPAPVIATMLGYSHDGTAQVAAQAGSPWSRYAPGDHARPRSTEGSS